MDGVYGVFGIACAEMWIIVLLSVAPCVSWETLLINKDAEWKPESSKDWDYTKTFKGTMGKILAQSWKFNVFDGNLIRLLFALSLTPSTLTYTHARTHTSDNKISNVHGDGREYPTLNWGRNKTEKFKIEKRMYGTAGGGCYQPIHQKNMKYCLRACDFCAECFSSENKKRNEEMCSQCEKTCHLGTTKDNSNTVDIFLDELC
jgi:hypothetical protein